MYIYTYTYIYIHTYIYIYIYIYARELLEAQLEVMEAVGTYAVLGISPTASDKVHLFNIHRVISIHTYTHAHT